MAFSMPRPGVLQQLSIFFSTTFGVGVPASLEVQLYRSAVPNNIFSPVPGAVVTIPFPPVFPAGSFVSGTAAFSVPVGLNDRLLLAARILATPVPDVGTIGYVSAGLAIA